MNASAITAQALAAPLGLILASPLALVALGLVPLIVILHSLNLRWRDVEVSSLFFWEAVVREKKTTLRLRSILRSLMLLAQVLAAALLAFALAQPLLAQSSLSGRGNVILVLDQTASMKSREGGRTRFDEARARALDLLPGLRRGSRMSVIGAGLSPRLLSPFTDDTRRLRRVIQAARPTDEAGDLRDSVLFALSLRDPKRDDRVIVITDGAFDTLGDLDEGPPWISLIRVGESRRNAGITALALRKTLGGDEDYEMFVDVRNFSTGSMSFPLTVKAGGEEIYRADVTLGAGEERGFSAPYSPGGEGATGKGPAGKGAASDQAGRIVAAIGVADDLAADNTSYAVLEPAHRLKAVVVGPGDFFLEHGLSALPNVTVSTVAPKDAQALDPGASAAAGPAPSLPAAAPAIGEASDVVVFDGVEPPPLEKGAYILIAALPPNLSLSAAGVLDRPAVTSFNRASPLLASVVAQSISVEKALRVEARGWTALLLSGNDPLALSYQREGLKVLFLGFTLDTSDLGLRPAFPLLLANALKWFYPSWLSADAEQIPAGAALEAPADALGPGGAGAGPIIVQHPDGEREAIPAGESPVVFRETSEVGFYTATAAGAESYSFAVSLSSAGESDITPRYILHRGASSADARQASGTSLTPLWAALAAAAILVILGEWLLVVRERR
jgi:hypothetical protein